MSVCLCVTAACVRITRIVTRALFYIRDKQTADKAVQGVLVGVTYTLWMRLSQHYCTLQAVVKVDSKSRGVPFQGRLTSPGHSSKTLPR